MLNLFWFFACNLTNRLVPILVSQYWIHMHLILQLKGHLRGTQMPWEDLSKVPQFFLSIICQFLEHSRKKLLDVKTFRKRHWNFEKNSLKYLDICLNMNVSCIFEIFDNVLTGWLSLDVFESFLCTGYIFVSFSKYRNGDGTIE